MAQRQYESLEAAAERLDVHPRSLRRAIARGELTGYRFGRKMIRIDREDVDALLQPIPTASAAS